MDGLQILQYGFDIANVEQRIFTTLPANTSYDLFDQYSFPDLLLSCCRKAVDQEPNAENGWKPVQENQQKSSSLALIPNPATDQVSVLWNGGKAEIEILDATGRKVAPRIVSDETAVFSTIGWPAGLYKVNVFSQGSRISKSLQVIR